MTTVCLPCLALLVAASPAYARQGRHAGGTSAVASANAKAKTRETVRAALAPSDHSVLAGGGSLLVRSADGVYMSAHASGLTPGDAVTAWFVFFNKPEHCATRPCTVADLGNADVQASLVNATGRIVGADGTVDVGAFRATGDGTNTESGPGLTEPFKAEIHLVLRSHGPALVDDADSLRQQLTMFLGGCPPNTCANMVVSIHEP